MKRSAATFILAALALPITAAWITAAPRQAAPASGDVERYRAGVSQYCVSCHNDRAKTGGLSLEKMDFTNVGADAEIWEKAVRKLRVGMMPPQGAPQPDPAMRQ